MVNNSHVLPEEEYVKDPIVVISIWQFAMCNYSFMIKFPYFFSCFPFCVINVVMLLASQALDLKPNYVRAWANMGISYANQVITCSSFLMVNNLILSDFQYFRWEMYTMFFFYFFPLHIYGGEGTGHDPTQMSKASRGLDGFLKALQCWLSRINNFFWSFCVKLKQNKESHPSTPVV